MARPALAASTRTLQGKGVNRLRHQGVLPAVVYGHGVDSQAIQMDAREFDTLRRQAGRNAVVDLRLDGGRPRPVMVHAVQIHPLSRKPIHADLFVVKMSEEMTVDVAITFSGTSNAVEKLGGTLLHLADTVKVRALPDAIPSELPVDISGLDAFDVMLHVSDILVPDGVSILTDAEEPIARVQAPRVEEEPVEAEEAGDEATAEGEGEGEPGDATAAEAAGDS